MLKKNKLSLILSSIVIMLPTLIGVIIWDKLPESMITHFGGNLQPDGASSKAVAVFIIPIVMLILQWIAVFITEKDPGNKNQNKKAMGMVLWILPAISLTVNSAIYSIALGREISPENILPYLLGFMFVIMGNYMPKVQQNSSLGIKLPWTFEDEENWNKTHRLSGKIWVASGLIILIGSFLPLRFMVSLMLVVLLIAALVPTIYSYSLHRKMVKENRIPSTKIKINRHTTIISVIIIVILLLAVVIPMFTGSVDVTLTETNITVDSEYWNSLTLSYEDIDKIDYREESVYGIRTNGFGSPRLLLGQFENDEFGKYLRYTYAKNTGAIIITSDEDILVIALETAEETKALYETLAEKIR